MAINIKKISMLLAFLLVVFAAFSQEKEELVEINTDEGIIVVKLYNDTPFHRDNFIKLVKEGHYNGTDFHRVIKNFMIQGGGNVSYTLPAEINDHHFHKKGALAAARMPDQVNPEKRSSGCQFYIVQGKTYQDGALESISKRSTMNYTQEQLEIYKTIGGTPFLDGQYTVFGEVVEGIEVVDKIAAVKTGKRDKPIKQVLMKMRMLE